MYRKTADPPAVDQKDIVAARRVHRLGLPRVDGRRRRLAAQAAEVDAEVRVGVAQSLLLVLAHEFGSVSSVGFCVQVNKILQEIY